MSSEKALIFILVAPEAPVFANLSYGVCERFHSLIQAGIRVLVPLNGRALTAYVLDIAEPPEGIRILNILDVLDEKPLFPKRQLEFYRSMSEYYHYPLGQSLASALPSGLNLKDRKLYSLTETGLKILKENPEREIVKDLEKKPLSLSNLKVKNKNLTQYQMDLLCREGLIEAVRVFDKKRVNIKTRKIYRPVEENIEKLNLSPKRREVFEYLKENKAAEFAELEKNIKKPRAGLNWLLKEGLIREEEKRIFRDPLGDEIKEDKKEIRLNEEQREVLELLYTSLDKGFHRFLLQGVTGSGKTEIYLRLVERCLEEKKTALVLVPEIALISQIAGRFRAYFKEKVAILHSGLSPGEKFDQWEQILMGKLDVIIGARSAIFAPLKQAGLIIVDEEHDGSYKQDFGLSYNARDMAILRAKLDDCPVLLGSATPSIQSLYNAKTGRFSLLQLKKRANKQPLPDIELVDLKKIKVRQGIESYISKELYSAIKKGLENKEQSLLFLNRRGYGGLVLCSICGEVVKCKHCDISLTFHQKTNKLLCHFCGFSSSTKIKCPKCLASDIRILGLGTEKLEKTINYLFPEARVLRIDQDTTSRKNSIFKMLSKIKKKEVDIIIGTQMLAKGHDFPNISLVGIINADLGLGFPDFRASEKNFQLLAQVAGRAGRGNIKGRVILQSYKPEHYSIKTACMQDNEAFYKEEIGFRKSLSYPPFSRMAEILVLGKNKENVKNASKLIAKTLKKETKESIRILGPVEAVISRISDNFRYKLLLLSKNHRELRSCISTIDKLKLKGARALIDIDPYSML